MFHLAFPITDVETTRNFYVQMLGCKVGRFSDHWIDFDLHGHQITGHVVEGWRGAVANSPVDGKSIPIPHFGLILTYKEFDCLADKLKSNGAEFIVSPYLRFEGQPGEQKTMFIKDPSGNGLEFKAFASIDSVFTDNTRQPRNPKDSGA